jgi:hypothetical protein
MRKTSGIRGSIRSCLVEADTTSLLCLFFSSLFFFLFFFVFLVPTIFRSFCFYMSDLDWVLFIQREKVKSAQCARFCLYDSFFFFFLL